MITKKDLYEALSSLNLSGPKKKGERVMNNEEYQALVELLPNLCNKIEVTSSGKMGNHPNAKIIQRMIGKLFRNVNSAQTSLEPCGLYLSSGTREEGTVDMEEIKG